MIILGWHSVKSTKAYASNDFIVGWVRVDCNPNIRCDSSEVGNTEIDDSDIRAVHRVDFPHSISEMSQ